MLVLVQIGILCSSLEFSGRKSIEALSYLLPPNVF